MGTLSFSVDIIQRKASLNSRRNFCRHFRVDSTVLLHSFGPRRLAEVDISSSLSRSKRDAPRVPR